MVRVPTKKLNAKVSLINGNLYFVLHIFQDVLCKNLGLEDENCSCSCPPLLWT